MKPKRIMLVYQAGIANILEVDCFNLSPFGRNATYLIQADFQTCINFASGAGYAGAIVRTAACNQAGNIHNATWTENLDDQPFSNKLIDVHCN